VGGVQAQLLSAAELALCARVDGITRSDVAAAVWRRRTLVRTYGPRGTIHLLPARELALWLAAQRAASSWRSPAWYDRHRLDTATTDAVLEAFAEALEERTLARHELAESVCRRVGAWARERIDAPWGDLLHVAALAGVLVFGPPRGARATFAAAAPWLVNQSEPDGEAALHAIALRYFRAYGPATHVHLARWFGLERDIARRTVSGLGLTPVRIEGKRALAVPDDIAFAPAPTIRLLPKYDAYILGSTFGRERIVSDAAGARLRAHPRGRYESVTGHWTLLVDGAVAGMWERREGGRHLELRVESFRRLDAGRRDALEAEVARVGEFLGVDTRLSRGRLQATP
jgi:Winged helix DNA-binding domain